MENNLITWCIEEIAIMQKTMKLMLEGNLKTYSYKLTQDGKQQIDETTDWIAEYKIRIGNLQAIIDRSTQKAANG